MQYYLKKQLTTSRFCSYTTCAMQNSVMWSSVIGSGKQWLVFLHGWGSDSCCFMPFAKQFEKTHKILLIDFPPFGKSQQLTEPWTLEHYEKQLLALFKQYAITNPIVVAHSFGARVAICLAAKYNNIAKLVLLGAAGLKPKASFGVWFRRTAMRTCKALHLKTPEFLQSADYRACSPVLRKTFSAIVSTHLDILCKQISCPCLLIWGSKDKSTPLEMGKRMHNYIANSGLYVIKGAGHFAFATHFAIVLAALQYFIEN